MPDSATRGNADQGKGVGAAGAMGVRAVSLADLAEVVGAGIRDFRAAPGIGLAIGALSMLVGWLLVALVVKLGMPYFAYPLAMGFALVAPFTAVGFYAVSDLLWRGERPRLGKVLALVRSAAARDLRWMALVTGFALVLWMDIAAFLFFGFMGFQAFDRSFIELLFTTPQGIIFLIIGNLAGALIAFSIFSISAVAFPMLYDRDIDFVTAMVTSVRLVLANPLTMAVWCSLIGALMGLSILSGFVGLLVTLPIIGHATWHLYKRGVAPSAVPAAPPAALPAS